MAFPFCQLVQLFIPTHPPKIPRLKQTSEMIIQTSTRHEKAAIDATNLLKQIGADEFQ